MSNIKSKTIFKLIGYGLIVFILTLCFAFAASHIYKELQIADVLLFEGILFSLLGISSLLGDNPNSTFEKEYIKVISSNTKENEYKELNIDSNLEPIIDSYATAITFTTGGVLAIITTFII